MRKRIPIEYYEEAKRVLDYNHETGLFTWKVARTNSLKVGDPAGTKLNHGYICMCISIDKKYKKPTGHRLAWYFINNELPVNVDHINGVRDDNRIINLRACTPSQNNMNRKVSDCNKSGKTGVSKNTRTKRWEAYITLNRKRKGLGHFVNKQDAINARIEGEKKYFGEFAPRI